jgi:hypothetical protein
MSNVIDLVGKSEGGVLRILGEGFHGLDLNLSSVLLGGLAFVAFHDTAEAIELPVYVETACLRNDYISLIRSWSFNPRLSSQPS